MSQNLRIDLSERFPHLKRAPITEAVIEIRAKASSKLEEPQMLELLKPALGDYPEHRGTHAFEGHLQFLPGKQPEVSAKTLGLLGVQFTSSDKKQIAKFQNDLFSFSRLHPYHGWDDFSKEAVRLWKVHLELARPLEIQRIGVRFINAFPVSQEREVTDYFVGFPDDLPDLNITLGGFLHRTVFIVPEHPYEMTMIKTMKEPKKGEKPLFILDIDVYSNRTFQIDDKALIDRLSEMRWLKNKSFFGSISKHLLKQFS